MRGTILWVAVAAAAVSGPAPAAESETGAAPFATPAAAQAYLSATVPEAVAANPKYRAKMTGTLTRWTIKAIAFGKTPDGSVEVSTDEAFDEYKGSKVVPGTHRARFAIDDVTVEDETSDSDTTESGAPALGVIFRCKGGAVHPRQLERGRFDERLDGHLYRRRGRARARSRSVRGARDPRPIGGGFMEAFPWR